MLIALEAILWFVRFLFGACIFSFLNVVIDRMPRGESVVKGRSHCTNCGRVLTAWELIPCISFLALKGRCKGCKSRIPVRDFCTEVIGGGSVYWLRDLLWLRQFGDHIFEGRSDFCVFGNITGGGPDRLGHTDDI